MKDHISRKARSLIREAMNLGRTIAESGMHAEWELIDAAAEARRKVLVTKVENLMRNQK